jgi:hypothetical protein
LYQSVFKQSHWLTIPYSQLFNSRSLHRIADFANLELDFHPEMLNRVDEFQGLPQSPIHPDLIHRHSRILSVASALGYSYSS